MGTVVKLKLPFVNGTISIVWIVYVIFVFHTDNRFRPETSVSNGVLFTGDFLDKHFL